MGEASMVQAASQRGTEHSGGEGVELRAMLEHVRLHLLALFRTLDRLSLAQDLPPRLRDLFELDADLAEALWALDQPPGRLNMRAMQRDTEAALGELPGALRRFVATLDDESRRRLKANAPLVRAELRLEDAYTDIPGRDPHAE